MGLGVENVLRNTLLSLSRRIRISQIGTTMRSTTLVTVSVLRKPCCSPSTGKSAIKRS